MHRLTRALMHAGAISTEILFAGPIPKASQCHLFTIKANTFDPDRSAPKGAI